MSNSPISPIGNSSYLSETILISLSAGTPMERKTMFSSGEMVQKQVDSVSPYAGIIGNPYFSRNSNATFSFNGAAPETQNFIEGALMRQSKRTKSSNINGTALNELTL